MVLRGGIRTHDLARDFTIPAISTMSYGSVSVSSSGSADTFGSWTELVADVGSDKTLIRMTWVDRTDVEIKYIIEIGEGASTAEAAITSHSGYKVGRGEMVVDFWIKLTDDARLSARVKDNAGAAHDFRISVDYV
jgi:hypothetical protein